MAPPSHTTQPRNRSKRMEHKPPQPSSQLSKLPLLPKRITTKKHQSSSHQKALSRAKDVAAKSGRSTPLPISGTPRKAPGLNAPSGLRIPRTSRTITSYAAASQTAKSAPRDGTSAPTASTLVLGVKTGSRRCISRFSLWPVSWGSEVQERSC